MNHANVAKKITTHVVAVPQSVNAQKVVPVMTVVLDKAAAKAITLGNTCDDYISIFA